MAKSTGRARDVNAVVHSHSPTVIPFSVTTVKLRPICHMSAFLKNDVPNFEIRDCDGMTDLLIRNAKHGAALARRLGDKNVALMRGHGNVCVGPNVMMAVYRAIYTEVNARLQAQAIALGGPINFLAPRGMRPDHRAPGPQRPAAMGDVEKPHCVRPAAVPGPRHCGCARRRYRPRGKRGSITRARQGGPGR